MKSLRIPVGAHDVHPPPGGADLAGCTEVRAVEVHSCGSDEMFVGRTGYVSAALWLKSIHTTLDVVPRNDLYKICDAVISSGRQHAKTRPNNRNQPSPPLMYAYYKTEYLGAAHGLCAVLQMLLSVPGYVQHASRDVISDIIESVNFLLSLQTPTGNFPCAMDEAPPFQQRLEEDELVHWCHGAPGAVFKAVLGPPAVKQS